MFKNPCKRCLVQACCIASCDALTEHTKFWMELIDTAKIITSAVIVGLIIYLLMRLVLSIGVIE